jgi:hypothetical protein
MSDETNRKIKRHKKPSMYIKEFIKEKYDNDQNQFVNVLKTHFINQKCYDLLLSDNFEEFLSERESLIVNKLKELVDYGDFETEKTLISPNSPFTNKIIFINTLKSCSDHIFWMDKYFSIKGLELLAQSMEKDKVKEIKIIMAIDKVDERFRSSFKDFRKEMLIKDINCELKVIIDSKNKSLIHDRFIITKYDSYNIPSPDIIARGQLSEISKSGNRKELLNKFDDLWQKSKDIIQEWNEIKEKRSGI